jgi:hypothetical protein
MKIFHYIILGILYMNSLRLSVCDGGFGGWGKGKAGEAAGDPWWPVSVCDRMWFSCYDASPGFVILQSDFLGRFLYVFSRCDLESIAHDNGVLRECDSMRCGRRSIKSKNKDKKRERERESCSNVFGVHCDYNGVRRMRLNVLRSQIDSKNTYKSFAHWVLVGIVAS